MRTYFALAAVLTASVGFGQAIVAPKGSGGYGPDSSFTTAYDMTNQVVFSGKVVGKSTYKPANGMADATSILVKVKKGATVEVALGPQWYVSNQVAHVYVGEAVRVIGSSVTFGSSKLVLAKQIVNTENNHVLALRDLNGYPYWVARQSPITAQIPANAIGGTVQSLNTVNINGVPYQGYVLQTQNGTLNVVTAPMWYANAQDYTIPVGTYTQVLTAPGPVSVGNGVVLANTMYSNGSAIVFQNNGIPVWYGFNP
jgi:hypothetical protein